MSVWKGWQRAILTKAKVPVNVHTLNWVNAWHLTVENRGNLNPLGAKDVTASSTDYDAAGVQNYPTEAQAIVGTVAQLERPGNIYLLSAMRSGDPYNDTEWRPGDLDNLTAWGVNIDRFTTLVQELEAAAEVTPGVTVPAGSAKAWRNLLRFYDKTVPTRRDEARKLAASFPRLFK